MAIGGTSTMTRREGHRIHSSEGNDNTQSGCGFADIWDPFAGGFASLWMSCRDTLCSLPEEQSCSSLLSNGSVRRRTTRSTMKATSSNVFLDPRHHTIQHNDSMSTATPREIDPEKLFGTHAKTFEALDRLAQRDDEVSCTSSISSKGMGTPRSDRGKRIRDDSSMPPSQIHTLA
jgi:hypothetical protein